MTAARWQQIKDILGPALECEQAEARADLIAHACADDAELQQEVEAFLAQEVDHLDQFADGIAAPRKDSGRRIGAYELLRELGRGGMGTVWLARRTDGRFEQEVAIKLLKRGTDTEEVLRRFHAERQILARLSHPNIARLFDGGETDDGLPFFVMEYVAGVPITQYAREQRLPANERLRLFNVACAAVSYAHRNLVIHRDLKPGNVLVTAEGEIKLLDFGIAKLLQESGDDAFAPTLTMQRAMTPEYASPEQLTGAPMTTVSDVYSLGVILYELLTGRRPHRLETRTLDEAARAITRAEPDRPSSALQDSAINRKQLRGDLDRVVLKALRTDPARRYGSANQLSEDLERYLAGRTVRARPDTFGYRSAKFIRRHKVPVTAAALLVIALASGVATTVFEARRAERRFGEVRRLTNSYLFEIHDAIRDLPGSTAARRLIVTRALEYLDRLASEARGDRDLQLELADAYLKVGEVQGKPYNPNLGDSAGALRSYTKSAEIAEPLAASEHGSASSARRILSQACENLGGVESRLSRWEDATRNHRHALAIREELLRSDPAHADEWQRGIVADNVGLGDALVNAHRLQPEAGSQRAALEHFRRALPMCETLAAAHPANAADSFWLAKTCSRIATLLTDIGAAEDDAAAYQEAAIYHQRTLALDEKMLRADPASTALRRNLADELIGSSYLHAFTGQGLQQSLGDCQRAGEIMESLAAADPANAEARQDLSTVRFVTGRVLQAAGERQAAAESYRECLRILEPLIAAHPENVQTAFDLARVRQDLKELQSNAAIAHP